MLTGSRRPPRARRCVARVLASLVAGTVVPLAAGQSAQAGTEGSSDAYDSVIDLTFPVDPTVVTFEDWYHAARSGGRVHQATDIMGSRLLPIHAAVGGEVTRLATGGLSGYSLTIRGDDGRTYNYIHLNNDTPGTDDGAAPPSQAYAPGIEQGVRVERGQHIAYMGDSGNAEATAPHLHFSITDPDITDPYGTHVRNPYASLKAAVARGDIPTGGAVAVPAAPVVDPPPPPPDLTPVCGDTVSTSSFRDMTAANVHLSAVECLYRHGIAEGLEDGRYHPGGQVSRLQMASFVARLLGAGGVALPPDPPDAFDDDAGSVHEQAVNQLVALGVIRGDTGEQGRTFYGDITIWRHRMAAWMARAYELVAGQPLPPSATDWFRDDSAKHHDDINRLAQAGIVQGTRPGFYSPDAGVRRDQMGSYLARTLAAATTG